MSEEQTPSNDDLTWPALLARWTAFAQAGVALPRDAHGDRWRAATAPIIGLHAVIMALRDVPLLPDAGERSLALVRARVLVQRHTEELGALWSVEPMPGEVRGLIEEARTAAGV